MIILLSPSKKQLITPANCLVNPTQPIMFPKANFIMQQLKKLSVTQLSEMMKISETIAKSTYKSIRDFSAHNQNQLSAVHLFQGDAFQKLDARSLCEADLLFAQDHLIILSALYGYLRPFDLVEPYRLDMSDPLEMPDHQNLTQYWKESITAGLNDLLSQQKHKVIINLASGEYFNAIDHKKLSAKVVQVDFKVYKNNAYKTVGIYAKRGRGLLARYIIDRKVDAPEALLDFAGGGFRYAKSLSKPDHSVITFELIQ